MWTTATLIVAGVWVSSILWVAWWTGAGCVFEIGNGAVAMLPGASYLPRAYAGKSFDVTAWQERCVPELYSPPTWKGWGISLPMWAFLLLMIVPASRAWLAKPLCPSACSRCGYDRAGLAAGSLCPECGAAAGV